MAHQWKVLDLSGPVDGTEVYEGPSEQEAREAVAALIVAGKSCSMLCTVSTKSTAFRQVMSLAGKGRVA